MKGYGRSSQNYPACRSTSKTKRFVKKAILYSLNCENEGLLKKLHGCIGTENRYSHAANLIIPLKCPNCRFFVCSGRSELPLSTDTTHLRGTETGIARAGSFSVSLIWLSAGAPFLRSAVSSPETRHPADRWDRPGPSPHDRCRAKKGTAHCSPW